MPPNVDSGDTSTPDSTPTLDALHLGCIKYLENQHTVLWGQYFDINKSKGREEAATWLAKVIVDVALTMHDDVFQFFLGEDTTIQEKSA